MWYKIETLFLVSTSGAIVCIVLIQILWLFKQFPGRFTYFGVYVQVCGGGVWGGGSAPSPA